MQKTKTDDKWRGAMDALGTAAQQAAQNHTLAVDTVAGDALQAAGLWDGRDETKVAAARSAARRLRIENHTYADRPPETLVFLDDAPVGKVTLNVEAVKP